MTNDLTFTGDIPVTINYNGDTTDIYNPLRTSSCDINIVSKDLLTDIYTARKDEVCVEIETQAYDETKTWYEEIEHEGSVAEHTSDYGYILKFSDGTTGNYNLGYYGNIYHNQNFFRDVDGDLCCKVNIWKNSDYYEFYGVYDGNGYWVENNKWKLDIADFYFYDHLGTSYKVSNSRRYYWKNSNWVDFGDGKDTDGDYYGCIYFNDDKSSLVYHKIGIYNNPVSTYLVTYGDTSQEVPAYVWMWDESKKNFIKHGYMQLADGTKLYVYERTLYHINSAGESLGVFLCKNKYTLDEDGGKHYWLVYLTYNIAYYYTELPFALDEFDGSCITYSLNNGDLYAMGPDYTLYYFDKTNKKWLTISTLTRKYINGYNSLCYNKMLLYSGRYAIITDPYIEKVEHQETIHHDGTTVWEGYQTPNVYTQPLTLNLDEISMTVIDPLSLMKYVTVDKILTRPNVLTYKELLGRALAYVKLDGDELYVEQNVTYGDDEYDGTNGLLDFSIQVSNFWDEGNNPDTLYDVVSEMLRIFCMNITFDGQRYWIYNLNRTPEGTEERIFDIWTIGDDGTLEIKDNGVVLSMEDCVWEDGEWTDNNTTEPTLEINQTYDKVTGVASTNEPSYSSMVWDRVDYENRDMYDVGYFNVNQNKTKGLYHKSELNPYKVNTKDHWMFVWNGVYADSDYDLGSINDLMNGFVNINGAYVYLYDEEGNPDDYGSIANFYGSVYYPSATSKTPELEKEVEMKKRITAYAPDNGVPPEFLQEDDLKWSYNLGYVDESNTNPSVTYDEDCKGKEKQGTGKSMQESSRIVYHQEYPNMTLLSNQDQIFKFSDTHSFSRTGIDCNCDTWHNPNVTDKVFRLYKKTSEDEYYNWMMDSSSLSYYPNKWGVDNVKVDYDWFTRYRTSSTKRCKEVWDKRRIDLYIKYNDGTSDIIYQFNGNEWIDVSESGVSSLNCFYLKKLMNNETLFHTDYKYNVIECTDDNNSEWALDEDGYTIYYDSDDDDDKGVVPESEAKKSKGHKIIKYIKSDDNDYVDNFYESSEGNISIYLPYIDAINVSVFCDVYNSTLLGMTGADNTYTTDDTFVFQLSGKGKYYDSEGVEQEADSIETFINPDDYNNVFKLSSPGWFIPINAAYVKAEHLDLDMEVTVPDSNLGQMFSESDIKYTLNKSSNYLETYEGPTFKINTWHNLVQSSLSYLIYNNVTAEGAEFYFKDELAVRPECHTVQCYMNYLNTIRKTYSKTLIPESRDEKDFNTISTYITSSEVGDNELLVVSDSIDLQTGRHSIKAIECQDLQVDKIESFIIIEVPRTARNALYNLPSAVKK